MQIGERIRLARIGQGLTVSGLAEAAGLTKGFISQVESGRSKPSVASLRRIARSLHVSVGELLEEAGSQNRLLSIEAGVHAPIPRTPRVTRAVPSDGETSSLRFLGGTDRVKRYMASLVAGASLVPAEPGNGAGSSCGVVVSGDLQFSQSPVLALLSSGDTVSWDESRRYRFENKGKSVALLFLELPERSAVPLLVDPRPVPGESRADESAYSAEGPLRLAAMRAHRRERVGR